MLLGEATLEVGVIMGVLSQAIKLLLKESVNIDITNIIETRIIELKRKNETEILQYIFHYALLITE